MADVKGLWTVFVSLTWGAIRPDPGVPRYSPPGGRSH